MAEEQNSDKFTPDWQNPGGLADQGTKVLLSVVRQNIAKFKQQHGRYPDLTRGWTELVGNDYLRFAPVNLYVGGPNADAVAWFVREIWPLLRRRLPALRWRLVGRGHEAVASLVAGDPAIECTGPVEDAISCIARSSRSRDAPSSGSARSPSCSAVQSGIRVSGAPLL